MFQPCVPVSLVGGWLDCLVHSPAIHQLGSAKIMQVTDHCVVCLCVFGGRTHIHTSSFKTVFFFIIFFYFTWHTFLLDIALVVFWEALMMMGPVNLKIAIWSLAFRTDGLIAGLIAGHCNFRRNMQGVLVL